MGNDISNPVPGGGGSNENLRRQQQQQQQGGGASSGQQSQLQQEIDQQPAVATQPSPSSSDSNPSVAAPSTPAASSSSSNLAPSQESGSGAPTPPARNAVRMVAAKPVGPAHDPMETPPTAQPESKPKKKSSKIKEMFLPTQSSPSPPQQQQQTTTDENNTATTTTTTTAASNPTQSPLPQSTQPPPAGSQSERSATKTEQVPDTPTRAKGATVSGVVPDVDYAGLLRQIACVQSPDEQARTFLRAFVYDFATPAKFEEVLNVCESFKKSAPQGNIRELDMSTAQTFMANHGIVSEGIDFRATFNLIDVDGNLKLSLIEFLLYKYRKPLASLFSAPPDAQAVNAMDNNILVYRKVLEEKRETEERMALLDKAVDRVDKAVEVTIAIKPAAPTTQSQQQQQQQPGASSQSSQDPLIVKSYGKTQLRSATAKAALESRSRAKEAKDTVQGINAVMAQTLQGAHERGERLQTMENKTAELANNASEYMKSIQKLKKQQENRSWWQL